MTPEERDVARANARAALSEHPSTCAGRECLLARAVLAFVPSGDVIAPVPFDHRAHVRVRPRKPSTNQPRGDAEE